ncbi:hypothetical protein OROMI_017719 [Orobanche minor]
MAVELEYLGSSSGTAFEYWCGFSVDEAIIPLYANRCCHMLDTPPHEKFSVEVRTKFTVKERGERETGTAVGSESFGTEVLDGDRESSRRDIGGRLKEDIGRRLRDYWLPELQIDRLIDKVVAFVGVSGGRRAAAVDLEICTVREEGEAMDAAVDRAMRPEYLAPLELRDPHAVEKMMYRANGMEHLAAPLPDHFAEIEDMEEVENMEHMKRFWDYFNRWDFLGRGLVGRRVQDLGRGLGAMQACGICGGKPFLGSNISTLQRCGHTFHYHCVVRRFITDGGGYQDLACPICRVPAFI